MSPWVLRLLIANFGVFLLQHTLPGLTQSLAFVPAMTLQRPWTPVTYMFVHDTSGYSHILFNMFGLYLFGSRVEEQMGGRRFIAMYLISGLTGAVLCFFFSPYSAIVGASGAIFGVELAYARYWPRDRIMIWGILPVQAWFLVLIMTLISLFGGIRGGDGTAHFAHLGGYVGAALYLVIFDRQRRASAPKFKERSDGGSKVPIGNWQGLDLSTVHEMNREEVERIVNKIKASGERSLSAQEREFLVNFMPKA